MKLISKIALGVVGTSAFAGLVVAGQYAGATLFVHLQHLPKSAIGVTTLRDYWAAYGDIPAVEKALSGCSFIAGAIPIGFASMVAFATLRRPKRELHGSARFARGNEIRATGLLSGEDGKPELILGKYKGKYLTFGGTQFVMLAAPTRSGKGVAVGIPNLLTYSDSMVVLDLKLENYKFTSGYRQKYGQKVFLWAPFAEDGRTHSWNVFDTIVSRPAHLRIGDVQAIGQKFYSSNVDAKTKFWNDLARNLFVGIVLYLMETATPERPCTMGEVLRQSSGMGRPIKEHMATLKATPGLTSTCTDALNRFLTSSDDVLNSILSTFNGPLGIFANPIVDAATSTSSFDINQVRRERMTIYVGIQPNRLEDAALLVNLFFSQLIDLNTAVLPEHDATIRFQCTLVMDEFTAIGRVNIIEKSNSFIAGYWLRLLTIIQANAQMEPDSLYGKSGTRTLIVNHAAKIVYPPTDHEEAKELSDTLGYFTENSVSRSRTPGKPRSESHSDQRRALMLPQELEEMPKHQAIILGFGKPILCDKAYYYEDPVFINRLKEISPSLARLGKAMPNEMGLKAAAGSDELCTHDVPIIDVDAWQAKNETIRAPKKADGQRVARASDLLAMDKTPISGALATILFNRVYADIKEMTGLDLHFTKLADSVAGNAIAHELEVTH